MAVFKCKMCGGDLNITDSAVVAVCEYCETRQTIPQLDNEKKLNLFNRANRLRMHCEFDKAASIYESIIAEFPEEPESYWGLCLCNYGIEYVDDPLTGKKIPTCHRASFESLQKDENFSLALEYADILAQKVYRDEAREIDRIMEEILSVSRNEKPYDVFICYKEKDENGERTVDSVLAQDIYDALTAKGLNVFFSRITLEDKLGTAYEPYIFAALNSAKVMLAVGTRFEYFNAVWVKNEWSRFLKIMAKDKSKVLIPCFKDIDAYDIPDEFKHLQAQDMSKIGFMQDLTRGILKIISPEEKTSEVKEGIKEISSAPSSSIAPLLKRAFLFLEDGNWTEADAYCEKILDLDPENAKAYLGKLMAELKVKIEEDLKNLVEPFDKNINYQKVLRFADSELKSKMTDYIVFISERNEKEQQMKIAAEQRIIERTTECKELFNQLKAINKGINQKEQLTIRTEELQRKKNQLEKAKTVLPDKLQVFQNATQGAYNCSQRAQILQAERGSLGLFAGKRKKEIDSELSSVLSELNNFERIKEQMQTELCGCYTEAEIAAKINETEKEIADLFIKIQNTYSKEEIIKNLQSDEIGRNVFDERYNPKVGDIYLFGEYMQDNNTSNIKKDIEWIVLNREGDNVLLLSKYGLDVKPYNTKYNESITWDKCTLRYWLNGEFFNTAFSDKEKKAVITTNVQPHKNSSHKTDPGLTTNDKIFLLSNSEASIWYGGTAKYQKCFPTEYAKQCGAKISYTGECYWWLRTPGIEQTDACYFDYKGYIVRYGQSVWKSGTCIRPALWIDLNSEIFKSELLNN